MDRFEADVMDDLMVDSPEGTSRHAMDAYDEFDEGDGFDEGDEGDDEFFGRLLGGAAQALGGLIGGGGSQFDEYDEGDGFDAMDAGDEFDEGDEYEGDYGVDAMEAAVADALDAGDGDEFFRRLARVARGAVNVARRVGRGVGQVARVVGPIASMIPIPQAQMIGRIANVAGRLLADGADEFEAFDELVDGLDEDGVDAAAPVLAGLLLRRALPTVARAAAPVRRQAVRAVTQAVRQAARTQGPQAARVVGRALQSSRRIVARRRLPARHAARLASRASLQVARRPSALRRPTRALVPTSRRATPRGVGARAVARTVAPVARQVAMAGPVTGVGTSTLAGASRCPRCGGRHLNLTGPVTITIRR
jgi:hypothetical protein